MEHALTLQDRRKWYLIASGGDIAMRVRSGMPLGETRSGELSFDPIHAQLELEIEDDGGLLVKIIQGSALAFIEGSHQRVERVDRDHRAEIHLPHNILRLDTDFIGPPQAEDTLQIRTVQATPEMVRELSSQPEMVAERSANRRIRGSGAPRWSEPPMTAALFVLGGVALVVLLAALFVEPEPTDAPARDASVVDAGQQSQSSAEAPPPINKPSATPNAVERTNIFRADVAAQTDTASPVEQGRLAERASNNVVTNLEPNLSPKPEATTIARTQPRAQDSTQPPVQASLEPRPRISAPPGREPSALSRASDPLVAPAPRRTRVTRPNRSAELTRERDLLAANLALAEGRLIMPTATSAYTLFNRVLVANPDSAEARRGLQAVREGLINRTFAQLASKAWDDARITLAAAADAGANPTLVTDLLGEVDYGERLADARAGRFTSRFPGENLVAIHRPAPRLRRLRAGEPRSVEVVFTVTESGGVSDIELMGQPSSKVAREVRRVMDEWRFEPVLHKGRPLPVRTSLWLVVGR